MTATQTNKPLDWGDIEHTHLVLDLNACDNGVTVPVSIDVTYPVGYGFVAVGAAVDVFNDDGTREGFLRTLLEHQDMTTLRAVADDISEDVDQ